MVYIFGHKKPDTDSVTAALSLSYLKNKIGLESEARILGKINKETEFVLNYFNVDVPDYLDDVKLQIKDLNYYKNCFMYEKDSINDVYQYMLTNNITGVPLIDNNKKFKGLITSKMIGLDLIKGNFKKLRTSYSNILRVLNGKEVLKYHDEINGEVFLDNYEMIDSTIESIDNNSILIASGDNDLVKYSITKGISLIIFTNDCEVSDYTLNSGMLNNVNVIKTDYDIYYVIKLISLSNYALNIITEGRNFSFDENDYYDDLKIKSKKLGFNNYPVVDKEYNCLGLIRMTDINNKKRKQVILVDHNEISQSVEGLNEAEILEIVDHHRIGTLSTNMPINFRNMTVGSTNTIIYSLFHENDVEIPKKIAGLMLSGILSDTLKFTSPTTTEYDKIVAKDLSEIAEIDIDSYSEKMFKAGANFSGKTVNEIFNMDVKIYEKDNKKILVSQIIAMNSDEVFKRKNEFILEMNRIKKPNGYDWVILIITDIIKQGSYLLTDDSNFELMEEAFNIKEFKQGIFLENCLSRKKQVVPLIMNVL